MRYVDPDGLADAAPGMPSEAENKYNISGKKVVEDPNITYVGKLEVNQSRDNSGIKYDSSSWFSGKSTLQSGFGANQIDNAPFKLADGSYYQAEGHPGVDRTADTPGQSILTPLYLTVKSVNDKYARVTFTIDGTDNEVTITHLTSGDLKKLAKGVQLSPGDLIGAYPTGDHGVSAGPHIHIQETRKIAGGRQFINPDTHKPGPDGATYRFRQGATEDACKKADWMKFNLNP